MELAVQAGVVASEERQGVGLFVDALEGFHLANPVLEPFRRDHFFDEIGFDFVDGLPQVEVGLRKAVESVMGLVREAEGFGGQAVFEGVHAGAGFSFGRDWAMGFCSIDAGAFRFGQFGHDSFLSRPMYWRGWRREGWGAGKWLAINEIQFKKSLHRGKDYMLMG